MWKPDLTKKTGAKYIAIVGALAEDIERGQLRAGERLPTHRELARSLGVTVGTITRAYAEAERRGLVVGEMGRGTFIRRDLFDGSFPALPADDEDTHIDLSLNIPPPSEDDLLGQSLSRTLGAIAVRSNLSTLINYRMPAGIERHRQAGADWIARSGLPTDPQRILICSGALHAMTVVFATLTKPGDTIFTESLTYPGMKNLAHLLHLRLQGVPMDAAGLEPSAFERACASGAAKVLYCVPTIHNPLGIVMPEARRREIAGIAKKYDVAIVEDDVHSFMLAEPPMPLSAFAPEQSYYILSTSKSLAGGIRIAYLHAPAQMIERLSTSLRATIWMAAPLMAEIVTEWVRDGTAARLVEQKRTEAAARQNIARTVLQGRAIDAHPQSYHLWLNLPEPWRSDEFITQARRRGVIVTPPEAFVPGREDTPHAVRVCLGSARSRESLKVGLQTLQDVLDSSPNLHLSII